MGKVSRLIPLGIDDTERADADRPEARFRQTESQCSPGLVAVGILKVRLDESGPEPLEARRGMSVLGFLVGVSH